MIAYIKVLSRTAREESNSFFRKMIVSFCGSVMGLEHYPYPHLIARTRMVTIHAKIVVLLNSRRIVVLRGLNGEIKEFRIVRLQRYSGK